MSPYHSLCVTGEKNFTLLFFRGKFGLMELKKKIFDLCTAILEEKIAALKEEMDQVQQSAISDTKSSMGDKYETGREVMMQEKNRLGAQLEIYLKQAAALVSLELANKPSAIKLGSLVSTNKGMFFIAVPLGVVKAEDKNVFVISLGSPVGKAMIGKTVGQQFSFNKTVYLIEEIL